jgi:GTP cyclohydrolase II
MSAVNDPTHVILTSHPPSARHLIEVKWGHGDPKRRGPVVGSLSNRAHRNVIGTHGGNYTVYRALSAAARHLDSDHRPDLTNTSPVEEIGPFPSWSDPDKIVSMDPWGARVGEVFADYFARGYDIRPTIAVTRAHIALPEITQAIQKGRLEVDGKIVLEGGDVVVSKAAIEPVWYLPGIAKRYQIEEGDLRRVLYEETGGMFPELVTRPDLKILLPPIGGITVYFFGVVKNVSSLDHELTARVHDECNGSDVFCSDICTCRPYLTHGIEEAIRTAQKDGNGVIVYFRKEGRALGEVTKFLVYNARKRQEGGDSVANYFYPLSRADARCFELARNSAHRQFCFNERYEIRRHSRQRHRNCQSRVDTR